MQNSVTRIKPRFPECQICLKSLFLCWLQQKSIRSKAEQRKREQILTSAFTSFLTLHTLGVELFCD